MELILERKYKKEGYTIGNLYIGASPQPSPQGRGIDNTPPDSAPSDKKGNLPSSPPMRGEMEGGLEDGRRAFCNTMEPPIGTPLESVTAGSRKAIPPGTYNIKMHWSPKFGKMLPLIYTPGTNPPRVLGSLPMGEGSCKREESSLLEFPSVAEARQGQLGMGRGSILIHAGNHPYDTQGCILVGVNSRVGMVLNSRDCLALLVNQIRTALYIGEEVKITIK